MRTAGTRVTLLMAAVVGFVTGCSGAPAPALSSPAPQLPEESIAYDELSVITSREQPFAGNCSQLRGRPELAENMGFSGALNDSTALRDCSGAYVQGGTLAVRAQAPTETIPTPWANAWTATRAYSEIFRRTILLDRYYAASRTYRAQAGPGCQVTVNTGSTSVLVVAVVRPELSHLYESYEREPKMPLAEQTCPQVRDAARQLLQVIDPRGGSRAST